MISTVNAVIGDEVLIRVSTSPLQTHMMCRYLAKMIEADLTRCVETTSMAGRTRGCL